MLIGVCLAVYCNMLIGVCLGVYCNMFIGVCLGVYCNMFIGVCLAVYCMGMRVQGSVHRNMCSYVLYVMCVPTGFSVRRYKSDLYR